MYVYRDDCGDCWISKEKPEFTIDTWSLMGGRISGPMSEEFISLEDLPCGAIMEIKCFIDESTLKCGGEK